MKYPHDLSVSYGYKGKWYPYLNSNFLPYSQWLKVDRFKASEILSCLDLENTQSLKHNIQGHHNA